MMGNGRKAAWIALEGDLRNLLATGKEEGRKEVEKLVRLCCKAGIDLIFPCSRSGDRRTIYASKIEQNIYGWDALGFLCSEAHENGIEIHPWIMCWADGTDAYPGLHVKTRDSLPGKEGWLCPARPESQRYFLDLIIEVLERYPIDGIHLDYIRYHDKPCYCDYHRSDFRKLYGADPLTLHEGSPRWEEWNEYNVRTITSFVRDVAAETHSRGRKVSAAVFMPVDFHRDASRNPFRLDRIGVWDGHCEGCVDRDSQRCKECSRDYAIFQRWPDWCREGYLDQVCPMNYTADGKLYLMMLEREVGMAAGVALYSGLSLFPENTTEGTREQTQQAFSRGAGICFFDLIRLSRKSEKEREEICAALK